MKRDKHEPETCSKAHSSDAQIKIGRIKGISCTSARHLKPGERLQKEPVRTCGSKEDVTERSEQPQFKAKSQRRRTSILDDYFKRGFFANSYEGELENESRFKTAHSVQDLYFRSIRSHHSCASYSPIPRLQKHCGTRDAEAQHVNRMMSREYRYLCAIFDQLPGSLREPLECLIFEGRSPGKIGMDRVRVALDLIAHLMMQRPNQKPGTKQATS